MKLLVERFTNFKFVENYHILFWLIKDISWCIEIKLLGVTMILPTIAVTIFTIYRTWNKPDFWVNMSVLFWITANSYWMCMEFFGYLYLKNYAVIPFCLGFISFFIYLMEIRKSEVKNVE